MFQRVVILTLLANLSLMNVSVKAEEFNSDISPIYLSSNEPNFKGTVEKTTFYEKTRTLYDELAKNGVIIEFTYTNDTGLNFNGVTNKKTGVKSISLLNMSLNLDTEKLGLWRGGNFFVLGQNIHGKSLTSHKIGDLQALSNIDAPNRIQLSDFGYEQSLFDDRFITVIGKQDANATFDALGAAGDFLNCSFILIPNITMPTYPNQGLGIASIITPVDWFNVKAGIFDGDSRGKELGFRTTFDSKGGFITLVEGAITPEIYGKPGNYLIGGWTHSADIEEIYSDTPATYQGNHGFYASFEQTVCEGLNVLGQFGWAPSDRNEIARYYGAGITYEGLLPTRDNDVTGIGMALTNLSRRYKTAENVRNEAAIELFHKFRITDYFELQPDLQIIINAGGARKTALALGIRSIFSIRPRTPVNEEL